MFQRLPLLKFGFWDFATYSPVFCFSVSSLVLLTLPKTVELHDHLALTNLLCQPGKKSDRGIINLKKCTKTWIEFLLKHS